MVTVSAFPVRFPMNDDATIFLLPTVHLSFVSSHKKETFVSVPLSISNPASCEAAPVSSEFNTIILSPILTVFELTVVVVPLIVKLPVTTILPLALISLKVTSSVVPTLCPIFTSPPDTVTPVPPVIAACALASVK